MKETYPKVRKKNYPYKPHAILEIDADLKKISYMLLCYELNRSRIDYIV